MLYKIVLKVVSGTALKWRYFCSVPQDIYADFFDAVHLNKLDMNAYLSLWAKRDWGVSLNMGMTEDIDKLKGLIRKSSKRVYPELYIFQKQGLVPDEDFWIKLWVSSHMKSEAERLRAE